ncbi:MAG: MOSC domain-containing protein [Chloroflexi bacterium]|jgi:MOSC domain-containing protein YiiM|nr:MOSC domain-containing protein [Chloroflexota bacterium]MDP6496813.1 MOSC domain-containing protein [Dehalococcoidia bacterium]MQG54865.1 MOSC domain-containing protein [SAR202 cluster bacterium]|tara:strand:- start:439 stop:915 length:477 start_codon:yes stop_codon:yes gene_type:complete
MVEAGKVVSLFIVDRRAEPMEKVEQLSALAGQGIEGDRYLLGTGTYSKKPEPGRQITLIRSEILESLKDKSDITVRPEESRRNVLTEGIEINELVGTEFYVGTVRLRAHRLTEPCKYLENLLEQPGLYEELWGNGGVSCEILTDGIIKEGDIITTVLD